MVMSYYSNTEGEKHWLFSYDALESDFRIFVLQNIYALTLPMWNKLKFLIATLRKIGMLCNILKNNASD